MRILVGKADIARFPIEADAERSLERLHVIQDVRGRRPGRLRAILCGFERQRMVFVAGETQVQRRLWGRQGHRFQSVVVEVDL